MDTQRAKYEREALRDGSAVQHPTASVLLKSLAKRLDAQPVPPKGREKCGELGPPRTERRKARTQYRNAPKHEKKSGFRAWAGWMGISV